MVVSRASEDKKLFSFNQNKNNLVQSRKDILTANSKVKLLTPLFNSGRKITQIQHPNPTYSAVD